MTRTLTFDGPRAAQRFSLLYTALLSGGDGKGERTRDVLRKESRLLDALDSISTVEKDTRVLDTTLPACTLCITQDDFVLLQKYADTCLWVPRVARDAVDLQDWLSAAPQVD